MKNSYFQITGGGDGAWLKVFAPVDGGKPVNVRELAEYLTRNGISFDAAALKKGLAGVMPEGGGETEIFLNRNMPEAVKESYTLVVSPDRMTATARFYPPSTNGARLTAEEFISDLQQEGIKYGINKEGLKKFFRRPLYCTDILVAKGQPPRHGEDARIEYYFETDLSVKPTLKEDGSVDFFNLNTVNCCKAGDVLARLFPGDAGEAGINLACEKIPPRSIKQLVLKHERNAHLSEDKLEIISDVDGHVTLVEDRVFVSNVLEVENVDNSTGNIDYNGNVKVNGNVCTNFSVKAQGDIEVRGVVEGAYLEATGNIIIARGMNGMEKGTLKAEGNVIAKYLENATVNAKGYVSTESILHSEVMAGTEVLVNGRRGFITGGKVSAMHLIQVKTLGSSMGAATVVEVGADPNMKQRLQQLLKQSEENKKAIDATQPVLIAMAQKLSQKNNMKPELVRNFQDMLKKQKENQRLQEEMKKEIDYLEKLLENTDDARIEVTSEVYGGVKICIADVSMIVKGRADHCRFVKSQGDVKMGPL